MRKFIGVLFAASLLIGCTTSGANNSAGSNTPSGSERVSGSSQQVKPSTSIFDSGIPVNPNDGSWEIGRTNKFRIVLVPMTRTNSKGLDNSNTEIDYNKYLAYLDKAIKDDPKNTAALNNRGVVYAEKGDYDKAIADFTGSIAANPNDANAYYNRGICHARKGLFDQAITDLTKALNLNPNDIQAYYNRGVVYYNKGDKQRAIADFNKVLSIDPDYADTAVILDFLRS